MSLNRYFNESEQRLTSGQIALLQSIPQTAIPYISTMNQFVSSSSSPTFVSLYVNGTLYIKDTVSGKRTSFTNNNILTADRIITLPDRDLDLTNPTFNTVSLNGALSTKKDQGFHWLMYNKTLNKIRWEWGTYGDELGANSGSDLLLTPSNDAGTGMSSILSFSRSTGFMGLGTSLPQDKIHIVGGSVRTNISFKAISQGALASENLIDIQRHCNDQHGAYIKISRSAGTEASPTTLGGAAAIGGIESYCYTTGWKLSSGIYYGCTAVSGANHSSNISFQTTNVGVPGERMLIAPDGKVAINTATPSYQLDVTGDINVNLETNTNVLRGVISRQYSSDEYPPLVSFYKSRGTIASPSTIVPTDFMGGIGSYGFTNAIKQGGSILFKCTAVDPSTKVVSCDTEFYTVNAGTSALATTITGLGKIVLPSTTTSEFKKLIPGPVGTLIPVFDFKNVNGFGTYVVGNTDANNGSSFNFKSYDYNSGSTLIRDTMTLLANGNVGVNQILPTEKLEIVGNLKVSANSTSAKKYITGASATVGISNTIRPLYINTGTNEVTSHPYSPIPAVNQYVSMGASGFLEINSGNYMNYCSYTVYASGNPPPFIRFQCPTNGVLGWIYYIANAGTGNLNLGATGGCYFNGNAIYNDATVITLGPGGGCTLITAGCGGGTGIQCVGKW